MQGRKKVAILGGGVGAIWAAYQLTSFPDWDKRFDITLYQMGWRLGGKCASGRNAQAGQRIEEHGLHIWSGFYDNAIKVMKQCYAEAQPLGGVFPSFDDAFRPFNNIVLAERVDGQWQPWHLQPPGNSQVPGEGGMLLSPWNYACMTLDWLKSLFEGNAAQRPPLGARAHAALPAWVRDLLPGPVPAPTTHLHHLAHLAQGLPGDPARHPAEGRRALLFLLEGAAADLHRVYEQCAAAGDLARRLFNLFDLGLAAVRGAIIDNVLLEGFDVIDQYEISEWLARHGAHPQSLDSACARGIYDYAFGFSRGHADRQHRAIAAGTSLRGVCRLMFTYKGAYFFKMQGGMGDTVFTPFYKVLKQRGVKFRFFHKVTALEADADGCGIERIHLQRQADTLQDEYQPLVPVKGLDCWPSQPDFAQLRQGQTLRRRGIDLESSWADWPGVAQLQLRRGRDFDQVILGISLGGLAEICGDLAVKDPAWDAMLRKVKTTRTLACQLWLKQPTEKTGWGFGQSILTCYAENFDTWADMSQLLPVEDWPQDQEPGSVAYFCGPMADDEQQAPYSDPAYPQTQYEAVREQARQWLQQNAGWIWPKMMQPRSGKLRLDQLVCAGGERGEARFDQQYFRANIDPSERYVLSVPGSSQFRLRSDESGFDNLYLAGDWTYNGINAGCVEAAAMSGMRAAAGLAGERLDIVGEKDLVPLPAQQHNRPRQRISPDAPNLPWPGNLVYGLLQTAGANALLPFPRAVVQGMLPEGLELDEQGLTAAGQHPVVLFFGWQDRVRPNFSPLGMSYLEFIISVPYVRHADPARRARVPGPFIYMPQLYLNRASPVWLGVYAYGYRKAQARIVTGADRYEVQQLKSGAPIISGHFRKAGPTGAAAGFPLLRAAQQAYALPLVSRTLLGKWLYSYFDFALGEALIQPIEMTIKIHNDQAAGLPAGEYGVPSIRHSGLGAFFLSTAASISNPLQSRDLGQRIRQMAGNPRPRLLPFG